MLNLFSVRRPQREDFEYRGPEGVGQLIAGWLVFVAAVLVGIFTGLMDNWLLAVPMLAASTVAIAILRRLKNSR
jgi:hypothetical protein